MAKPSEPKPEDKKTPAPASPDAPVTPKPLDPEKLPEAAGVQASETRKVSAGSLAADDKDTFPKREGDSPSPSPDEGAHDPTPGPGEGEQAPIPRNVGGRPKGKKDSYPRGRPGRPDWPNEATTKKTPKPGEPIAAEIDDGDGHEAARPVNFRGLACLAVDMTMGTCVQFLGPGWKPQPSPLAGVPGERDAMIDNVEAYLRANEIVEIPPGWMLTIAVCGYALPRIGMMLAERSKAKKLAALRAPVTAPMRPSPGQPAPSPAAPQPAAPQPAAAAPMMDGRKGAGSPHDFGPEDE